MIEARLTNELTLILYDTEQAKEIKSFPKRGTDPAKREAAEARFKEMKRDVRGIVKNRVALLKRQFLTGESTPVEFWMDSYLKNPVLTRVAQLMVWCQDARTFTVYDGQTILQDGSPCSLSESAIILAHPAEMKPEDVAAWQAYFLNNMLKQPFAQVWEPVAVRDPGCIRQNRYVGCEITVGHILGLERQDLVRYSYSREGPSCFEFTGSMILKGTIERRGNWLTEYGPDNRIILGSIERLSVTEPRKLNRVIAWLDNKNIVRRFEQDDDEWLGSVLPDQTLAQINAFLKLAIEKGAGRCTAMLLDYKNANYPDYADVDEFTLEW